MKPLRPSVLWPNSGGKNVTSEIIYHETGCISYWIMCLWLDAFLFLMTNHNQTVERAIAIS